ncbi:glycosyltransferase [Luteimonas terricola]|uniref:Glycosyl transferase n=1 Tax=Luteimonas terricola TaxID=645597 RepID=A0ABQ2EFI7_9GAMM|nr:glycosyltransferase [Luteimonas terricola]GGK09097.1 glycosyl transferase [Luteimonas terricola]
MRISHVVENLNRGGLERVVIDLAKAQAATGHDCQVICLFEAGSLAPELASHGIPVIACGKRDGADLRAIWRLRRALAAQRTEVLHSHNDIPHYYAMVAALGLGLRRVVNTRHGMGGSNPASRRERLFRQSMRWTDVAVAVSEAAGRRLADVGLVPPHKLHVLPNGIRAHAFRERDPQSRAQLATSLGLAPDTQLVGFVGRLNWAKDLGTMIAAFAHVHARRDDVALVLVGEGGDRSALETAIAQAGVGDHVFLLGDRSDVHELLPAFSMFAMSSISEGYSIALLEACACALPIVATRVGGNSEIVTDGVNGLVVPPRDPEALAAAIDNLLDDPRRAAEMGRAGRAWLLSNATFEVMASRYRDVYANGHANGRA